MREVVEFDVRKVFDELEEYPDKGSLSKARILTNDEEWVIWEMFPRKSQRLIAKTMRMSADTLKAHHDRLAKQGGPKGKRPEWMK